MNGSWEDTLLAEHEKKYNENRITVAIDGSSSQILRLKLNERGSRGNILTSTEFELAKSGWSGDGF